MCGIAGILSGKAAVDERILQSMADELAHRGPDDAGYHVEAGMGLAHRRLSIIDLSEAGRQPMHNERGTVWTAVNGEIYNYRVLRSELEGKGHRFYSNSDSEVVVHCYEEYGERFVTRLDGMFAIALWDREEKALLLYRDRLGIKPMYYADTGRSVLFASEPKAILKHPDYSPGVADAGLHHFLSLSYVPGKETLFEGLYRIQPGGYLKVASGRLTEHEYWRLEADDSVRMDVHEALDLIDRSLAVTVKKHLISDVPVGVFLSSGLDSSLIASYAHAGAEQELTTFTMGFGDPRYSEIGPARDIAARLGMPNKSTVVEPDVASVLRRAVWHLDDLVPAHFPSYYLNREVKKHFTVALSGDGGDELFGGYLTYQADIVHRVSRHLPAVGTRLAGMLVNGLLPASDSKVSMEYMVKRFLAGNSLSVPEGHGWWNGMFAEDDKRALYAPSVGRRLRETRTLDVFNGHYARIATDDIIKKLTFMDLNTILPHNYLTVCDRLSMAHSVEVRPPLLDHHFVQMMFNIPGPVKMGVCRLQRKRLAKLLALKKFGPALVARKKQGFSAPINPWMRTVFRPLLESELGPARLKALGYFDERYVQDLIKRHIDCKENLGYHLWNLVNFSIWHRVFIEGE